MKEKFEITPLERISPLWMALMSHLEVRLAVLRCQNDGNLDERDTAVMRGRIAEIKALMSLNDDKLNLPPL